MNPRHPSALLGLSLLLSLSGCDDDRSLLLRMANRPEKATLDAVEHEDVRLEDLLASPERWLDKGVRFECRYHGPAQIFTPVYTPFSAAAHMDFSVWTPEARLWDPEGFAADHPFCYVDRRDAELCGRLKDLKPFDLVEIEAFVSSVFGGHPYLRVDGLDRHRGGPRITKEGLRAVREALILAEEERWEEGASAARSALLEGLPAGAEGELRKALGLCLMESGDARQALPELGRASGLRPADVEVLKWEGRAARELALAGRGRHAESVALLEKARRADPDDAEIPLLLCEAYAAAGRPADALRTSEEAVEMNPLDPDAYLELASLRDAQGDLEGSIRSYRDALELDAERWQAWAALARVQVKQADFEGAAGSFEEAFDLGGEEVPADDHYLAGRSYQALDEIGPARDHLEIALLDGRWEGAADAHAALGEMAYRAEDWAGAEKAYEAALGKRPRDPEFLGCLGLARLRAGKFAEARKALEESLERGVGKPGSVGEHLAVACMNVGDLKAAERAVERACKAEETAERRFLEGEIARRMLRPKDACRAFERVVALDPGDVDAWMNLGIVRIELARHAEAEAALEEAARLDPENPFVLTTRAYLLLVQGKDGAMPLAEKAFAIVPENPEAEHTYGWALLAAGRAPEAVPVLQTAAAAGEVPQVHYHLAQALASSGKPAEARPILEALVKARGEYAREANTLLKSLPDPAPEIPPAPPAPAP